MSRSERWWSRTPGGPDVAQRLSLRRRLPDALLTATVWGCAALVLVPLMQVGGLVADHLLPALRLTLFWGDSRAPQWGLRNAILGTGALVTLALLMAAPLGVLAGVYLAERGVGGFGGIVRLAADALTGAPSVVVGYVGYVALVSWLGWGFSLLAGAVVLALLMLPYLVRATDYAVSAVPRELREASLALGASTAQTVRHVVLRAALPGIVAGAVLATSVAIGETAPLIYTVSWSNAGPAARLFHSPVGYLTAAVWRFIVRPLAPAHVLAYAATLLLLAAICGLNLVARAVLRAGRWIS